MSADGSQKKFSRKVSALRKKSFVSLAVLIADFDQMKHLCEDLRSRRYFSPTEIDNNVLNRLQLEAMNKIKNGSIPNKLGKELADYLCKIYLELYKFLNKKTALLREKIASSILSSCGEFLPHHNVPEFDSAISNPWQRRDQNCSVPFKVISICASSCKAARSREHQLSVPFTNLQSTGRESPRNNFLPKKDCEKVKEILD
ncbi:hypothetical protein HNY73_010464 [Argiope bruennichi]|uniref:Uncharacterized protein n=1 Tax=Argiope bruennichi TaxID=94029 RepID=A0A8T0F3L3_ARGBR|nr:hypothetical protein HNY73_010464 [Argiope bruennichi]